MFFYLRGVGWGVGGDAVNFVSLSMKGMGESVGCDAGAAGAYEVGEDAGSHKARELCSGEEFFQKVGVFGDFRKSTRLSCA